MTGIFVISLVDNGSYVFGRDARSRCRRCNAVLSKKPADARGVILTNKGPTSPLRSSCDSAHVHERKPEGSRPVLWSWRRASQPLPLPAS